MAQKIFLSVPSILEQLQSLVKQVPAGRVTTFKALADALGDPGVARFVGMWLAGPEGAELPVHRVVYASGEIARGRFADQGPNMAQLREEGVHVVGTRVEPLGAYFFWDFRADRPLARLREEQDELAGKVRFDPLEGPALVGGLDIGYRDDRAVAVCALCTSDGQLEDYVWADCEVRFPYISGYLAWRELPPYLRVWEEVRASARVPDVVLVDGNGILHPRRLGIASHLGLLLDVPTVGVAKRPLCGDFNTAGMTIGEWRPVVLEGETVAAALRTGRNRTLFISPGHRTDLASALDVVAGQAQASEQPSPLRWAHELAREAL
ncbi:MAG: endonuclease V [Candidatus Bipolaricaulota bacterium]